MPLIAFRPECQITVDPLKNHIFHKVFAELQTASALPLYLENWAAALAEVQPHFSILADVSSLTDTNVALQPIYAAAQPLVVGRGVAMVAETYRPNSPSHQASLRLSATTQLPVRPFLDAWEADQFLDSL